MNFDSQSPDMKRIIEMLPSYLRNCKDQYDLVKYNKGDKIVRATLPLNDLYYIIQGKAKICLVHENGKITIIDFIGTGDYIGEHTLLEIEMETKDVIALTDCLCLKINLRENKNKLRNNPEFLYYLCQYMGKKVLRRSWFHSKNLSYELKYRLAAHILNLEDNGVYKEKHTETAEFLGTSYRHLLQTFKALIEEGYITRAPNTPSGRATNGYIINREMLSELAQDIVGSYYSNIYDPDSY